MFFFIYVNFFRFMPTGSYLNAFILNAGDLAREISDSIKSKDKYYNFFKWHSYYSYHPPAESADTDPLCKFCAFLNNASTRHRRRVYERFTQWWNEFEHKKNAVIKPSPIKIYEHSNTHNISYYIYYLSGYLNASDIRYGFVD